ncbi:MAG: hypothetical protein AAFY41_08220, partial [Bacteroidota bacterium]
NPRDIFLYYDRIDRGLFAHARKEVVIENDALGYRMIYLMKVFEMHYKTGQFFSLGIPRFEELVSKRKAQIKKWEKARKKAYLGSFNHFLNVLVANTFTDEGFIVQEFFRVPNSKRPPQQLIDQKIAELKMFSSIGNVSFSTGSASTVVVDSLNESQLKSLPPVLKKKYDSLKKAGITPKVVMGGKDVDAGESKTKSDSLAYWFRVNRMPMMVDSIGMRFETNERLIEDRTLTYMGKLQIIYMKEPEDPNYAYNRPGGNSDNKQTSVLHIKEPLQIYRNGYYDVNEVLFEGYFGWSMRIAEMLPLGYIPRE